MKASEMRNDMRVAVRCGTGMETANGVIEAIAGGKAFVRLPDRGYWVSPNRLREIKEIKP